MKEEMHIRTASTADIDALRYLFQETIRTINLKDYSTAEVDDWASCGESTARWQELISSLYFIVAVNDQEQITGFASVSDTGYLHSMFIHKDFQNQGIASLLYKAIEKRVKQNGLHTITSEVSITARPFFERQGFIVDQEQKRKAAKLYMTNFRMSKRLD